MTLAPECYDSATTAVAALLSIPPMSWGDQDWEICSADPDRALEFLEAYQANQHLPELQRHILMQIVLASFNERLASGEPTPMEGLEAALLQDFAIHKELISYWCVWRAGSDPSADEIFRLTPFARLAWKQAGNRQPD